MVTWDSGAGTFIDSSLIRILLRFLPFRRGAWDDLEFFVRKCAIFNQNLKIQKSSKKTILARISGGTDRIQQLFLSVNFRLQVHCNLGQNSGGEIAFSNTTKSSRLVTMHSFTVTKIHSLNFKIFEITWIMAEVDSSGFCIGLDTVLRANETFFLDSTPEGGFSTLRFAFTAAFVALAFTSFWEEQTMT